MNARAWLKNQATGLYLLLLAEYQLFRRRYELAAYQRMTKQNQRCLAELWEQWELTNDITKKESLRQGLRELEIKVTHFDQLLTEKLQEIGETRRKMRPFWKKLVSKS